MIEISVLDFAIKIGNSLLQILHVLKCFNFQAFLFLILPRILSSPVSSIIKVRAKYTFNCFYVLFISHVVGDIEVKQQTWQQMYLSGDTLQDSAASPTGESATRLSFVSPPSFCLFFLVQQLVPPYPPPPTTTPHSLSQCLHCCHSSSRSLPPDVSDSQSACVTQSDLSAAGFHWSSFLCSSSFSDIFLKLHSLCCLTTLAIISHCLISSSSQSKPNTVSQVTMWLVSSCTAPLILWHFWILMSDEGNANL